MAVMDEAAGPAGIAVIHSIFNVTATILWLPFAGLLEKPAFAVEQGRNAARRMATESHKSLRLALSLVGNYGEDMAECVDKMEAKVDRYEDELGTYLVKLSHKDLSEHDSHSVAIMLHCIGDFERISDHAVNIMESARELYEKGAAFSPKAMEELGVLSQAVEDIVQLTFHVFDKQDVKLAEKIEPLEELIDELSQELKRRHVKRLQAGTCTIEMGFVLSDITTSLERIADHCSNIGVCITQVREDLYDTHSHLDDVASDASFRRNLEAVRAQYVLP